LLDRSLYITCDYEKACIIFQSIASLTIVSRLA
jgi:hypothetical protein